MKIKAFKVMFLILVAFFALRVEALSIAVNRCNFTRDLWVGSRGDDVRCLQDYLRSAGYGQYGYSDGVFGMMTRQSLISWQVSQGIPASGYFDATSRSRYFTLVGGGSAWPVGGEQRAVERIREALDMIEDAEDEIDDSSRNTSKAENLLDDAKENLYDAVRALIIDRDYNEAYDLADEAYNDADDAIDEVDGGSSSSNSRTRADDAIDDAKEAIDDAWDEIEKAERKGAYIYQAEALVKRAEDKLDDATEEFDDKHYDDAEDLAQEAEDLADAAVRSLGWY